MGKLRARTPKEIKEAYRYIKYGLVALAIAFVLIVIMYLLEFFADGSFIMYGGLKGVLGGIFVIGTGIAIFAVALLPFGASTIVEDEEVRNSQGYVTNPMSGNIGCLALGPALLGGYILYWYVQQLIGWGVWIVIAIIGLGILVKVINED